MSEPTTPDQQTPEPEPRRSVRDNWWWRGGLWLVAGGAIFYYQWDSITGAIEGIWANWVMAAIGLTIAVVGAWRLGKDWLVERATRSEPPRD